MVNSPKTKEMINKKVPRRFSQKIIINLLILEKLSENCSLFVFNGLGAKTNLSYGRVYAINNT